MNSDPCLVFDVGGSNLRAGLYDHRADCLGSVQSCTTPDRDDYATGNLYTAVLETMHAAGLELLGSAPPSAIGVAFAGPVDAHGLVMRAPTIWRATKTGPLDLARDLRTFWPNAPVVVLNDVTAAGLRYRSAIQRDFCVVTVSSGIGNKIFLNGTPVTGEHGRGGEIGHLQVAFGEDAPVCDCGGRGHLGAIASGRGTLRFAREKAERDLRSFARSECGSLCGGDPARLTNPLLAQGFRNGDPWATDSVREPARYLGRALASLHLSLGLERFVIYGGFAAALGPEYVAWLSAVAAEASWDLGQDWRSMITLDPDGDSAGLIGAGRAAAAHGALGECAEAKECEA